MLRELRHSLGQQIILMQETAWNLFEAERSIAQTVHRLYLNQREEMPSYLTHCGEGQSLTYSSNRVQTWAMASDVIQVAPHNRPILPQTSEADQSSPGTHWSHRHLFQAFHGRQSYLSCSLTQCTHTYHATNVLKIKPQ